MSNYFGIYIYIYISEKNVEGISYICMIGYKFLVIVDVFYFLGRFFININNFFNSLSYFIQFFLKFTLQQFACLI